MTDRQLDVADAVWQMRPDSALASVNGKADETAPTTPLGGSRVEPRNAANRVKIKVGEG